MNWAQLDWSAVLKTAPAAEPLTYSDAKSWLRLPDDTDQTLVTAMIVSARQKVEQDTGRRLITQDYYLYMDAFPDDAIVVPFEPLASVQSLRTTTAAGVTSTAAATIYQVDIASGPPRIFLADDQSWPSDLRAHRGIEWTLRLGYGAAGSSVPGPLVEAMRWLLTMWYGAGRAGGGAVPQRWAGYDALIAPFRLPGIS